MSNKNEHVIDALEELIEISRDGQNGYRDGSEHVKNAELKRLLSAVSLERAKFAGDLENEAVRYGKSDVDRSGTTLGAIHRGWANLKAALGGGDDAILASMEQGDKFAKDYYDRYIQDNSLPDELLGIIRNQAQAVVGTLDRIQALRRQQKAA
jgi:uncharacterized protein (TIGR02284 family)